MISRRVPSTARTLLLRSTRHSCCPVLASQQTSPHINISTTSFFSTRAHQGEDDDDRTPTALVVGSSGALGSVVSRHLSEDLGWQVLGADVVEVPNDLSLGWELDGFVRCPLDSNLTIMTTQLVRGVNFYLHGKPGLDAIICASGGWKGDPPTPTFEDPSNMLEPEVEEGARLYADTIKTMRRVNLDPLIAAGYIAQHYMATNGLFASIGATAALSPTPGMLGYGLAKSAAHHFVQTMGACTGKSVEPKSVRKAGKRVRQHLEAMDTMTVVGILPTTIDTAANRRANPNDNFDKWTKPFDIAKEIGVWLETPSLRPHSGSLVKVYPKQTDEGRGATFELVR